MGAGRVVTLTCFAAYTCQPVSHPSHHLHCGLRTWLHLGMFGQGLGHIILQNQAELNCVITYKLELCLVGQGLNDGVELFMVLVDAALCQKFFCGPQKFVSFMVSCISDLLLSTFQLLCLEAFVLCEVCPILSTENISIHLAVSHHFCFCIVEHLGSWRRLWNLLHSSMVISSLITSVISCLDSPARTWSRISLKPMLNTCNLMTSASTLSSAFKAVSSLAQIHDWISSILGAGWPITLGRSCSFSWAIIN